MKLYVLRHAEAESHGSATSDEARELTVQGRERLADAARGLRRLGLKPDVILTSPLVRAMQTAEIVAAEFGKNPVPRTMLELATGSAAAKVLAGLAPWSNQGEVIIVGHEPQLSAVVSLLLTGAPDRVNLGFKKGACVALEIPPRAEREPAQLLWMMTQGQLRKLRKKGS